MTVVRFEIEDGLGILTISNPPLNLYSDAVMEGLAAAVDEIVQAPIRVLLTRAEGDHFSGGVDVNTFVGRTPASARQRLMRFIPVIHKLERLPFPTIAAVQGLCVAAGMELMLAHDLVIAGQSARIGQSEALIGTSTLLGGAQRIAARVGPARAKEMVYSATFYPAEDLARWGVINRVVPDADLQAAGHAWALQLAKGPTRAHEVTKRLIDTAVASGLPAADSLLLDLAVTLFGTEDMPHGVNALLEHGARNIRNATRFTGR